MVWLARCSLLALVLIAVLAGRWGFVVWPVAQDDAPVPMLERQARFERAVAWFKANEAGILVDGNAALWWMIQTAAERSQDPYLSALVQRSLKRIYPAGPETHAWKRMVDPAARVTMGGVDTTGLSDYQRLFYHAVTCHPVALGSGGDTRQFLTESMCRPRLLQGWPRHLACETHQAMGLALFRRTGCPLPPEAAGLSAQLLDDIAWQLEHDVIVRDAYIQQVLVLMWLGDPSQVQPGWVRRVLDAQRPDGSWSGRSQYMFLPEALQPDSVRSTLSRWWPSRFPPSPPTLDLHASAQGLLLTALSLDAAR